MGDVLLSFRGYGKYFLLIFYTQSTSHHQWLLVSVTSKKYSTLKTAIVYFFAKI